MFNILRNCLFPKLYMFLCWYHPASTFFTHRYVLDSLWLQFIYFNGGIDAVAGTNHCSFAITLLLDI